MGYKGDWQRPHNKTRFDENFERAFGPRCPKHPTYKAIRPPTAACEACRRIYAMKHGGSQ